MEDNMNCQMKNITITERDGKQTKLEYAFIRGSKVRWFILPDMLKNAPMFKRPDARKGLGLGIQSRVGRGGPPRGGPRGPMRGGPGPNRR